MAIFSYVSVVVAEACGSCIIFSTKVTYLTISGRECLRSHLTLLSPKLVFRRGGGGWLQRNRNEDAFTDCLLITDCSEGGGKGFQDSQI